MRACVQCGTENPDGAVSCRSCGSVQQGAPSAAAPVISDPDPGRAEPATSVPAAEAFGQAPPPPQRYEQSQPTATMVAGSPVGGAGAPGVELFRSDQRPHSASALLRGEALVLLGAALLFIASFLPFYDSDYGPSENAWTWFLLPLLILGFGSGVLAGVLVSLHRYSTVGDVAGRIGLSLKQLVGVLAVVSAVDLLLSTISAPLHGVAQWLGLASAALLLVGGVFAEHVPALMLPVATATPVVPGTPPMAQGATAWTPNPAPAPAPAPTPAPAPEGAVPAGTAPFWFSVSAPTLVHDRGDGTVRGELQPGRWYLATTSFGTAVEVSADEFGTAILHDLTVLQRA